MRLTKGEEYDFVEMADITPGHRYVSANQKRIYEGGGSRFQNGDILFSRITPCLENGKIAQYQNEHKKKDFGSTEFIILRNRERISIQDFIYYLALSNLVRKPAEKSMFGASGRQRVDLDAFGNIEIPSYTPDIQEKIASILNPFDDLIEINLNRIRILEEITKSLYNEWFVKLKYPRHKDAEIVEPFRGSAPKGWQAKKLDNLAETTRVSVSPEEMDAKTPYVGLAHIPQKSIALSEWGEIGETKSTKLLFKKDDILFAKIRPYLHKVAIAPVDGACSSDTIVIRPKTKVDYPLVLCCVSSEEFVAFADKTSKGTQMPRTDWKILQNYEILYPPSRLLKRFGSFVTENVRLIGIPGNTRPRLARR